MTVTSVKSASFFHGFSASFRTRVQRVACFAAAIAGALAIAPGSATAAPRKPPQVVMTPTFVNWSGAYAGIWFGGGVGSNPWSNPTDGELGTTNLSGFIAAAYAGYNWQFGNTVVGIEASGGFAHITGDFMAFGTWNFAGTVQGLESVTGRLGIAVDPIGGTLLFVKGGLAAGQYKFTSDWAEIDTHFEANQTLGGFELGAGLEHQFSGTSWANLSVRAEYSYYNFGNGSVDLFPNTDFVRPYRVNIDNWQVHTFTIGADVHFGGH